MASFYVPGIVIDVLDIVVNKEKILLLQSFCPAGGVHNLPYRHMYIFLCTFYYACINACMYICIHACEHQENKSHDYRRNKQF